MDPSSEHPSSSFQPAPDSSLASGSTQVSAGDDRAEVRGPGGSPGDEAAEGGLSVWISWTAIVLATFYLAGGYFYLQFLAKPQPVEKLPAAADMQLRFVIGLGGMGQGESTADMLAELTEKGPLVQRLAGVLAQVEAEDAEAAAETLEKIQLEMEEVDYQPKDFEQELLDATHRIVQDQRFQAQEEAAQKETQEDVSAPAGATDPEGGVAETAEEGGAAAGDSDEGTEGDTPKARIETPAAGEFQIVLAPPVAIESQQLDKDLALIDERLGIVGKLVNTWYADSTKPGTELKSRIQFGMFGLFGFFLFAILALLLGMVLLVTLVVLFSSGELKTRMQVPGVYSHIYLEGFAVWMTMFVVGQIVLMVVLVGLGVEKPGPMTSGALNVIVFYGPMILGVIWTLARHPDRSVAAKQIGFRSDGIFGDMAHGVLTYISFLPIIGLAMLMTAFLTSLSGAEENAHPFQAGRGPSHPISEQFGGSIWSLLFLYFVAAISAPIVEEIVFRGLLFRWLRDALVGWGSVFAKVVDEAFPKQWTPEQLASTFGILVAAVINSFIFASIHPQGLLGIPALMSIGICMSYARAWRGGLIAPMTIHAIHNGTLVTLMALMNL